jgi:hypothetical protein
MIQKASAVVLGVAIVVGTGCAAHVPMATPEQDVAAKQFVAASDLANLYVYRNEQLGFAVSMSVLLDGSWLGDTAALTYLHVPISPGDHRVISKTENTSEITFTAEPGKNYFVWQEVKMGMASARSALHLVEEEKGRAAVAECSLAKSNAPARPAAAMVGCTKDTDCKGDRICSAGSCVAPAPSGPGIM